MKEFEQMVHNILNENENLTEHYENLFPKDEEKRHKYKHEVFNKLQKSYEKIGGIAGSGFNDPDDMVKNVHMWKLHKNKHGEIIAGKMYKDSKGIRKGVAAFTNGTDEGKAALAKMNKHEATRSVTEVSGPALGFLKKTAGEEHLKKYAKSPEDAQRILGKKKNISTDNVESHYKEKYPEIKDKFYSRGIGDHAHTKVMIGTEKKMFYK